MHACMHTYIHDTRTRKSVRPSARACVQRNNKQTDRQTDLETLHIAQTHTDAQGHNFPQASIHVCREQANKRTGKTYKNQHKRILLNRKRHKSKSMQHPSKHMPTTGRHTRQMHTIDNLLTHYNMRSILCGSFQAQSRLFFAFAAMPYKCSSE